jgi:hypothetical protein
MAVHSAKYQAVINSERWRKLKQRIIDHYGYRCQRCKRERSAADEVPLVLQLHHKTYDNLGREQARDVELLCLKCHSLADAERVQRTAMDLYSRRIIGWARKCYGDEWEYVNKRTLQIEFHEWLRRKHRGY